MEHYGCFIVYSEKGVVSGTTTETDRPAFQQMVSDIVKNGVRTVLEKRCKDTRNP